VRNRDVHDRSERLAHREFSDLDCFVVAMNDGGRHYDYPDRVRFEIAESDTASSRRAADFLNVNDVDAVHVPYTRLAADVLRRVTEEFVSRDGTDYGTAEKTLEEKVMDVRRQLERGEAAIVYDPESCSINVVPTRVLARDPALHGSGPSRPDIETEAIMGDKSPKSKQRDQQQKDAAKVSGAVTAKAKQDSQSRAPLPQSKGRK
jgi:uncharacterized protein YheU (UPF0270 family)